MLLLHLLFALVEAEGSEEATLRRVRCKFAVGGHRYLHGHGNPKDHALSKEQDVCEYEDGTRIRYPAGGVVDPIEYLHFGV